MLKSELLSSAYVKILCVSVCLTLLVGNLLAQTTKHWVGTWGTAPQLVEPYNMPPSPGLTNNSLRQVARISLGGDTLQLHISNEFSEDPVTLKAVKVAISAGGSAIFDSTSVKLSFNGNTEVTIRPGTAIVSDPFVFPVNSRTDIAITTYYGETSETATGHPGSRTTSYLIPGNDPTVNDFTEAATTNHWYNITGIDVLLPENYYSVAILGNSITDGRGSITNMQNRWPDLLSEKLLANPTTQNVAVLNMGIGGNCVLWKCLGPSGVDRYERDVLKQNGIRAAIIFEGVNDMGGVKSAESAKQVSNGLIAAYTMMIDSAHANNLWIYGATITPFKGNGYYNEHSEACRTKVNDWIRNSGRFDAVIDFDRAVRDPNDSIRLISAYQNDGLHPDTVAYRLMIEAIDLELFEGLDTLSPSVDTLNSEQVRLEMECGTAGQELKLVIDPITSNKAYARVQAGARHNTEAPQAGVTIISVPCVAYSNSSY